MIGYDPRSPVPPYEQVRAQVARLVHEGRLPPGSRLPTVRRLAGDLGLAVNTVARAYRELERDGLVATRGRNGTVVAGGDERLAAALDAAAEYAARVRGLGLPADRALELVRSVLDASAPEATEARPRRGREADAAATPTRTRWGPVAADLRPRH